MKKNLLLILGLFTITNTYAQNGINYQNNTIYATTNVGTTAKVKWVPGFSNTSVGSRSVDDGLTNTQDITTTLGSGTYAAEICGNLIQSGYTDWYLPSADELLTIKVNTAALGITLNNDYYWSSTEYAPNWSQTQALAVYGSVQGLTKTFANAYVVCIRKESTGNPMTFSEITYNGITLQVYPIDNALSVNQGTSISICNTLDACGYDDWYLPSDNEALAISGQLQPFQFPNTGTSSQLYWTSTSGKALYGSYTPTYASSSYFKCRCVREKIPILNVIVNDISCSGNNNGSVNATIVDGSGNYTYHWNTGASTSFINNLSSGQYTVTATDITNNTVLTETVTISEPTVLSINSTTTNVNCSGNNNGTAQLTITGGTGNYTTSWINNINPNALSAGTYTATITDANNCTIISNPITVTEPTALSITESSTNVNCNGATNGSASITVSGGTSGYTYAWSNNATTQNMTNIGVGTYTCTITDANNCTVISNPITVTEPTALSITESSTNINCNGATNGSASITVSGATSGYTYAWSNNATTQNITNIGVGTYTCTITDANNCTIISNPITITEPTALSITESSTNINCNGATNGSASITVSGGTSGYTYAWSNNATTQNITNIGAGTYTCTITDANNCVITDTAVITEPSLIMTLVTATICQGESYEGYTTSDNFVDTLINGDGCDSVRTIDLTVNPTQVTNLTDTICHGETLDFNGQIVDTSGTYQVTLQTWQGCDSIVNLDLTVQPSITILNTIIIDGTSIPLGSIDITPSGDTLTQQYLWSNGVTTQDVSSLGTGFYGLTITDNIGCQDTFSFEIGVVNTFFMDNKKQIQVKLYPNPTRENQITTLEFDNILSKDLIYRIVGVDGKILEVGVLSKNELKHQIKVPQVVGMYYLQLFSENQQIKVIPFLVQ
jgi:hypothetical protein